MPAHRTLATILLSLAGALTSASLQANELKDIARQVRQGQQSAALNRLYAYLDSHPADAEALFLKGVALTESNKPDEAIKVFNEMTEKYPGLPEPYNNLAVLYAGKGQYDKARAALESALKTHPSYATAHNNLADVYAHMASEAYDKALQLDKTNSSQANKLALIQDLPTSGQPIMLAAKTPDARVAIKEPAKPAALPPPLPIKPAEPIKPEPAKPAASVKPAEPAKSTEPAMPPLPVAKAPEAKPAEPVKTASPPAASAVESKKPLDKNSADKRDNEKAVKDAVQSWALAWSSQNVETYLASYADSFKTPNGESRKEWEKTRRDRLTSPASIKVDVSGLRVSTEDADHARVDFKQSYRAGSNVMRTSKTLIFKNAGGKWLIEQERTGR
jgi:tetratricopeptide (TPR) repeat protein